VGTVRTAYHSKDAKQLPQAVVDLLPELREYALPPRTPLAEMESFEVQSRNFRNGKIPDQDAIDRSILTLLERYPKTSLAPFFDPSHENELLSLILNVLDTGVNLDAGVGVPYCNIALTVKPFLGQYKAIIVALIYQRIKILLALPHELVQQLTAEEKVILNLCDPVRFMIKNELHKLTKIEQKRFRLISSVSFIDAIVQRVVYFTQNIMEIQHYDTIPSKPGFGLSRKSQRAKLYKSIPLKTAVFTDVTAWDWSVKYWQLLADAERRVRLCTYLGNPLFFKRLVFNLTECTAHTLYCFSNGILVAQLTKGIQNSGHYCTSSTNSFMRVHLADLIGASWAVAMGDDDIEEFVEDAQTKYLNLGFQVKGYDRFDPVDPFIDFCSHRIYPDGKAYPLNWPKMVGNYLLRKEKTDTDGLQLIDELKDSPEIDRVLFALGIVHLKGVFAQLQNE
jgi:hypothetical protein